MTDQLSGCEADKVLDAPLRTIVACLAEVLPKGPAQTALYWVAVLCILAVPIVYKYYIGVLAQGAQPEGSLERQDYDKLRASLAGGNLAARLYAKWLTAFLDAVDHFFGDAEKTVRTLFPHAFGLQEPAPMWTAPAFDRCLLLALIYPIATIFLIWAVSGHVGPAEKALFLSYLPGLQRGFVVAAAGFQGFVLRRLMQTTHPAWLTLVAAVAFLVGAALVDFLWVAGYTDLALSLRAAFGVAAAFAFAGAGLVIGSGAPAVGLIIFGFAVGSFGMTIRPLFPLGTGARDILAFVVPFALCMGVVFGIGVLLIRVITIKQRWLGVFLLLFLPAMIVACLGAADVLSPMTLWERFGPFLLFIGLLTLLNAPFDWASLGLTRALLRRGLELGGWWPYLLALVDACLAGVIIALLALTMVLGVQAFDELAVHGGGEPVLPLDTLFDGIAKNPAAPEYWWAYALLLSSMIPSLINLAIGGKAFTRGIPWLARLLLQWIPEGKAVPEYKRQPAAIGLTVQMFAGAFLGIAAQALLAWGLIFHLMPWIGLDLLDMARAVAAVDLPARLAQLFAGTP
jgi:hypothetical protein